MRLTHLKLAGFKSFVDPTTLHIHGQRVGVVGPNGCGKSNIIESVRWVLGESSAKEMRADAMDAVIFNGSAQRKPISRASVELVFDNSLGGASGEWSQYAEISVKRVIEREKGSTYYINNTSVRRRDVADLFLGTGLGSRAYAIIGQNTISRIIEAKPEEIRIFLEEAAGISKYKERRRETELRLRDTRENLSRVQDIRQEIEKQIAKLDAQAAVAEQFHRLQESLKLAQGKFWLLKKRDASLAWEKAKRNTEKLVNELEAQIAALRGTESALEQLRQEHYASTETVQAVQAQYYQANAEVSNLEQQVKHTTEARERLTQQQIQLQQQLEKNAAQRLELDTLTRNAQAEQQNAIAIEIAANSALDEARGAMPQFESAYKLAETNLNQAQTVLNETAQNISIISNTIDHLTRRFEELELRLNRLDAEAADLRLPDTEVMQEKHATLASHEKQITKLQANLDTAREQEKLLVAELSKLREAQQTSARALHHAEAQLGSLEKLQAAVGQSGKLEDWVAAAKLNGKSRLWQGINIKAGWGTAMEAVLGARLNAIQGRTNHFARPPVTVALVERSGEGIEGVIEDTLYSKLEFVAPEYIAAIQEWLAGVYVAESATDLEKRRATLKNGECVVTPEGDIFTRHSMIIYAANPQLHGVLDRAREIISLKKDMPKLQSVVEQHNASIAQSEMRLVKTRETIQLELSALQHETQIQHQAHLEAQKIKQEQEHIMRRQSSIAQEQSQLKSLIQEVSMQKKQKSLELAECQAVTEKFKSEIDSLLSVKQVAEAALTSARSILQATLIKAQESSFGVKLIVNNINELEYKIKVNNEEKDVLGLRLNETQSLLAAAKMEGLKSNLESALDMQRSQEAALAKARNAMADAESNLQKEEQARLQREQALHPLRDKLEQARLSEQEARLVFEQCAQSLISTQVIAQPEDEALLTESLGSNAKASDWETQVNLTRNEIEALGPVNLAAIQELAAEQERKGYLDSQAQDLEQATATLEEAIRKIDSETKSKLLSTYEDTNRNFGELFGILFGGGQARLELLGDEILDNGMQVFAQPPGKKNTSIHLLSGGEKALTALALVFALFRLNPAPFCLMDEVDAPLDDSNTERFCNMVRKMSEKTQFLFVSHNKITMEMAQQLIGITMQESGVSRIVEVDIEAAIKMQEAATA